MSLNFGACRLQIIAGSVLCRLLLGWKSRKAEWDDEKEGVLIGGCGYKAQTHQVKEQRRILNHTCYKFTGFITKVYYAQSCTLLSFIFIHFPVHKQVLVISTGS